MNLLSRGYRSSLGKKYVMAITGFLLFLFVIVHMAGNLQVYLGREPMNAYAELLKSRPGLLWTARGGLFVIAVLHIISALQLAAENRAARPEPYAEGKPIASLASRTILLSGLIVFAFIVYHLMHFTFGVTNPDFMDLRDASGRHDVFSMVVEAFRNPYVSAFYIISMGLLCLHLSHGVSSLFQSLGIRRKGTVAAFNSVARIAAIVIFIGNCSIPISILAGVVK
ncbi:MAG TPA: succinate dehydrogenase cytochrome b subunit [Blastocatellia bacterium]|nr:succinate dehydrogenase cytochrome b subunit [Blastocatellia bacterium]